MSQYLNRSDRVVGVLRGEQRERTGNNRTSTLASWCRVLYVKMGFPPIVNMPDIFLLLSSILQASRVTEVGAHRRWSALTLRWLWQAGIGDTNISPGSLVRNSLNLHSGDTAERCSHAFWKSAVEARVE